MSSIRSFSAWQGAVRTDGELRILIKTTADRAAAIHEWYSCDPPANVAFDVAQVCGPYVEWVIDTVSADDS
jgi:uncharacterized protein involved in tolerance to divalent cations